MLPFVFLMLFGVIDFGSIMYRNLATRQGVQQSARIASVGTFGTTTSCVLTPAPASSVTTKLMCQTKALTGVIDQRSIRVNVVVPSYARSAQMLICTESLQRSISGVFSGILKGSVTKTKAVVRIEKVSTTETPATAAETSLSGSWSWCS